MAKDDIAYRLVEAVDEIEMRDGVLHITAIVAGRTRKFALGPRLATKVLNKLTRALAEGLVLPFKKRA